MKTLARVLVVLLLSACAPSPPHNEEANAMPAACLEDNYDWLVGTDADALPTEQLPENRRVLDHTVAYTQDFIEGRLNVIFDKTSRKVMRVFCG